MYIIFFPSYCDSLRGGDGDGTEMRNEFEYYLYDKVLM